MALKAFLKRIFKISEGESLDRFYLFKLFGFGVFLHHIHASDPHETFHNHPWSGLSIIFGKYWEYVAELDYNDGTVIGVTTTGYCRRFFNWIPAKRYHQVRLTTMRGIWTLFFHLPKSNKWSVIDRRGEKVDAPWEGEGKGRSYTAALTGEKIRPILISCHNRIEELDGYETFAKLRHHTRPLSVSRQRGHDLGGTG